MSNHHLLHHQQSKHHWCFQILLRTQSPKIRRKCFHLLLLRTRFRLRFRQLLLLPFQWSQEMQ